MDTQTASPLPDVPDSEYIEQHVRTNSVRLGTRYINLTRLAEDTGCTTSYLSKVFRLEDHRISLRMGLKIAERLGITVDALVKLMDERKKSGNRPLSLI